MTRLFLTADFGMTFFLRQIPCFCGADRAEESQFGVKGRADTAASQSTFSLTDIQAVRGPDRPRVLGMVLSLPGRPPVQEPSPLPGLAVLKPHLQPDCPCGQQRPFFRTKSALAQPRALEGLGLGAWYPGFLSRVS